LDAPGRAPHHHRRHRDQADTAAAEIAGRQSAQQVLAAAQKFFEIGRFRPPRLWSRAPRAAALITPRHMLLLAVGRMIGMAPAFGSPIYRLCPAWLRGVRAGY